MEREVSIKPYVISDRFFDSRSQAYKYGVLMFGYSQSERYNWQIEKAIETLSVRYNTYPECRHLPTKSHMYRNIIFDAHLIIYRITHDRIEVLDMLHSASSIRKIRDVRKIHL